MIILPDRILKLLKKKFKNIGEYELCGILSGAVGILLNLFLCGIKFIVGSMSHSISVTADGVNNLSDAASNIVTIIGAKISGKPMDKEHPFGHGRAEYISGLAVAFLILLMGFELGKESVIKIFSPEKLTLEPIFLIVLGVSFPIKLFMAYFNHKLYKHTGSLNFKAVKQDSLNDCLATGATVLALVISSAFDIGIFDGAVGLAVAVIILISGIKILKEITDPLLGEAPDRELTERLEKIITADELILGVHDIIVHNYGHNQIIASAHAEVPCDVDLVTIHEKIDSAEKRVQCELGIMLSVHIDPVDTDDLLRTHYKELTEDVIKLYNPCYSIHDFRLDRDADKVKLIFDVVIPFEDEKNRDRIENDIISLIQSQAPDTEISANFEHSYT